MVIAAFNQRASHAGPQLLLEWLIYTPDTRMQTLMHIPACITEIFLSYPSFFHLAQSPAEEVRPNVPLLPWQQWSHTLFFFFFFFFSLHPTPQQALEKRSWGNRARMFNKSCGTSRIHAAAPLNIVFAQQIDGLLALLSSVHKVLDFMMWQPFVVMVLHVKWYALQAETEMGWKPTALMIGG